MIQSSARWSSSGWDLWSDAFIRPSGERKGEPAASLKGRLLKAELIDPATLAAIEQYELITRGIGYLNRPKDVTPKEGDPFLACTIGALAGPVEEPEYRYINTIVTAPEAQHLVRRCVQAIEAERKVLVAFRLNDMKADPYLRTKGEHAGEPAASLESRLIHIGLIKIDGQLVYPTANQPPLLGTLRWHPLRQKALITARICLLRRLVQPGLKRNPR